MLKLYKTFFALLIDFTTVGWFFTFLFVNPWLGLVSLISFSYAGFGLFWG